MSSLSNPAIPPVLLGVLPLALLLVLRLVPPPPPPPPLLLPPMTFPTAGTEELDRWCGKDEDGEVGEDGEDGGVGSELMEEMDAVSDCTLL